MVTQRPPWPGRQGGRRYTIHIYAHEFQGPGDTHDGNVGLHGQEGVSGVVRAKGKVGLLALVDD